MATVVEQLPPGARVLVVRLRSLGDCVLTTPALALLKNHRPDLEIGVVVEDRFAQLFQGNPDVSAILPPSKRAVLGFHPALTLNYHGGSRSAALTGLSLAPQRAGFGHFRQQWVYNLHIPRAQEILGEERTVHTAEHLASAVFYLGVPITDIPRARLFCAAPARRPAYSVLHPMASAADKTWPAANFLKVARHLREAGLPPVIIGGPGDDLSAFAEFERLEGAPLEGVKSLLSGAELFVGNDSGPAHMAAAFGVPVVVLYGTSDPIIWAPWRTRSQVLSSPSGLAGVPVEQAIAAVERLRGVAQ
ncbi:glycosyltransferase family 9 protein [Paludibaculum fermentans]|uniref:Glycosyltransferase family 9 protein n=1 Tax=Paludibaculum fermentans TaxID=1473598 RepID=A0A7S7NTZ2_PALFE|nr:glycosyltransferase family 9 protein [Paludibaculum fermentans]QOY89700.1 glycosyltransferase family 9 protein [Paludibaculum fermentans]